MPEIQKAGYKRFWELKQLTGRNSDGSKRSVEGYRDMTTGGFHAPEKGWSGEPPEFPSGERDPVISDKFKQNYDKILWNE
jgi:hypothetical protein